LLLFPNARGIGRIKVISTSKIKKITATKKNRKEKGTRAELRGSNPHSKGDSLSKDFISLAPTTNATTINTNETKNETIKNIHTKIIIFFKRYLNQLIGSQSYLLY